MAPVSQQLRGRAVPRLARPGLMAGWDDSIFGNLPGLFLQRSMEA